MTMDQQPARLESASPVLDDLRAWDVLVGKVVGHWDRASLKIASLDASANRFQAGSKLCIEDSDGARRLIEILASKPQGRNWICDCGLSTLEEAQALKGATLWIHRTMRAPLAPDEFYLDDVLGLRVITQSGEEWGEIDEILETPAHNVYVTPCAMIPAHSEFIVSTDWEERVLVVRDVPELKQ